MPIEALNSIHFMFDSEILSDILRESMISYMSEEISKKLKQAVSLSFTKDVETYYYIRNRRKCKFSYSYILNDALYISDLC